MKLSAYETKVLQIILNNPDTYNMLLKQHNHKYAKSIINKWFDNRVGLEFETATSWGAQLNNPIESDKKTTKGLIHFDYQNSEKTISFNQKGLVTFNYFLNAMKEHVPFNNGSGIHLHINCERIDLIKKKHGFNEQIVLNHLIKLWNYTGTFNSHIISDSKTAIRIHDYYGTLEYRILPMSYDWKYILKSIMICQYCTKEMTNLKKVDLNYIDAIWAL